MGKKDRLPTGRKFCSNLVYSRILLYGNGTEKCSDLEFFSVKVLFTRVRILVERRSEIQLLKFSHDVFYHLANPLLINTRHVEKKEENLRIPFVTSFQYGVVNNSFFLNNMVTFGIQFLKYISN